MDIGGYLRSMCKHKYGNTFRVFSSLFMCVSPTLLLLISDLLTRLADISWAIVEYSNKPHKRMKFWKKNPSNYSKCRNKKNFNIRLWRTENFQRLNAFRMISGRFLHVRALKSQKRPKSVQPVRLKIFEGGAFDVLKKKMVLLELLTEKSGVSLFLGRKRFSLCRKNRRFWFSKRIMLSKNYW